jgi:hypothetical protein
MSTYSAHQCGGKCQSGPRLILPPLCCGFPSPVGRPPCHAPLGPPSPLHPKAYPPLPPQDVKQGERRGRTRLRRHPSHAAHPSLPQDLLSPPHTATNEPRPHTTLPRRAFSVSFLCRPAGAIPHWSSVGGAVMACEVGAMTTGPQ